MGDEYLNKNKLDSINKRKKCDLRMKSDKKEISKPKRQEFIRLFKNDYSMRKIAREMSVSPSTVKKYLNLEGIQSRPKNIVNSLKNDNDLLIGLYLGLWAGDGTQYLDKGYRVKFTCHSSNKELIKFIQKVLLELFDKRSSVQLDTRHRAYVRFNSEFIYNFSKKISLLRT